MIPPQFQLFIGMQFPPPTLGGAVLSLIVAFYLGQTQYLYISSVASNYLDS